VKSIRVLLAGMPILLVVAGCHVPLQSYRLIPPHPAVEIPRPTSGEFSTVSDSQADARNCADPASSVCLAFLEVDDMGELWDKGELDTALSLIRRANDGSREKKKANPGEESDPIVVVFVHGWKNNAKWGNGNVTGFKSSLQVLYQRNSGKRPVIGVYVGWRGDLTPAYLPVARQFSYFNREATAIRIPGASLSSALTEIAMRTHENPDSLAIFVGHSFGGLLLERTVSEMTASSPPKPSALRKNGRRRNKAPGRAKRARPDRTRALRRRKQ